MRVKFIGSISVYGVCLNSREMPIVKNVVKFEYLNVIGTARTMIIDGLVEEQKSRSDST